MSDLLNLDEALEDGSPTIDDELEPSYPEEKAGQSEEFLEQLSQTIARHEYGGESEHRLASSWSFFLNKRFASSRASADAYTKGVKKVASFATAEGFWGAYQHLVRPSELPATADVSLFKDPISPMWEDAANKDGGKWIVRIRKGFCSRYWEELLLALIGEQFGPDDGICGAVVSIRYHEDIISIWNSDALDTAAKNRILLDLRRTLRIPPAVSVEYKAHNQSIKDGSSFRNTSVVRQPRAHHALDQAPVAPQHHHPHHAQDHHHRGWAPDGQPRRWHKRPGTDLPSEPHERKTPADWKNIKELTPWEAPTESLDE